VAIFVHRLGLCESEQVGEGTRIWAFAHVMSGARVGRECNLGDHVFIESGAILGDRVTVKNGVVICDGVEIGDDVFIGVSVLFANDKAPRSPRMPDVAERYKDRCEWLLRTKVGRGATIGSGVVLLPGLSIGEYAMVGAGSVVTRDVAPHALVVGSPARQVGFVCVCGERLGDAYTCGSCGREYSEKHACGDRELICTSPVYA
jgi:UDP-2-acetamido-3-amino-2,3-dideoxy-glucuronate N-acetyltransferase